MNLLVDVANAGQLLEHLRAADSGFHPPLSQRVDLADYAAKLAALARRIEAWDGDLLAGLLAVYANQPGEAGFITNVSVLPSHQGQGIGAKMLTHALALATEIGLPGLRLEVSTDNTAARALYRRHGFTPEDRQAGPTSLFLHREL